MNFFINTYSRIYQHGLKIACNFLDFSEPTIIDKIPDVPSVLSKENVKNVLIVTDDILHNKLGLLDVLKSSLEQADINYYVFDKTVPNPTIANIEEALSIYKSNNCSAIIAFGGGSPMDCAKGVGCRVARPNKQIPQMKGILHVMKKLPTLIAVPTTSGTGSEATLAAVVSDPTKSEKYAINDPVIIPKYAVLDPTLTIGLPPHITSTTGVDALTHAVEAYIGYNGTKNTNKNALSATKLIFENLEVAFNEPKNLDARKNMQIASYQAGIAFTRAFVGLVHAMAHTLGGKYGTPHGLANAVILPYVLDFYGEKAYNKLATLGECIGLQGTTEEKAKNFIKAVRDLNAHTNIPEHIPQIDMSDIDSLVEHAYKESVPTYPMPVMATREEIKALFLKVKG